MPDPTPPATTPMPARRPLLTHALSSVVLVAMLLSVLAYWYFAPQRGVQQAEATFRSNSEQAADLMQQRLLAYELLVRGGASLQVSLPRPNRAQWQRYVSGLAMDERFPAVRTLGFAVDADRRELDALVQLLPGMPALRARNGVRELDRRDTHALVLYTAPESPENDALVGVDLSQDLRRRQAIEQSASSGALRMTLPVPALGSEGHGSGHDEFTLLAPVYADGGGPAVPGSLRGFVFVQVGIAEFVDAALDNLTQRETFRILDVTSATPVPVYASAEWRAGEGAPAPAFSHRVEMDLPGRRWAMDFESRPLGEVQDAIPGLRLTLLLGVLASLLVFGILLSMARVQARVEALATRMSDSWRRSEQRFRSAMEYSAIGKALLDKNGRILDANPALLQLLGSTRDALVGSHFGDYFADDESTRTVEDSLHGGDAYRTTRRLRRSDGEVRHASLVFASVPGETGDELASLVQVEDVTERLRNEARVQALNRTLEARVTLRTRELSHANQELEAFAYSVSHDLRAPLRSIDGFSRLLTERYGDALDESGRDYLGRIRGATARMSELIDALLRMARVSRGELKRERVDLSRLAREVAAELQAGDPSRKVRFELAAGLQVHGDPMLLRTLMENVLGNAWKFTVGKDDALIEFGAEGGEFFVRDNGAGFSQDYAGKLFRPFQRLHSEQAFAGHGIGLASVKRIVERHGGSVRAEGQEGRGASFYFTLPQAPADLG